jgi:heme-degrading monooxygenase HmoA
MIAVIFEVEPRADRRQAYLDLAAELKPLLEKIDGFLSIERFESLTRPGKILSLSFWRDEAAVGHGASSVSTARPRRPGGMRSSPTIGCGSRA